MQSQHVPPTHFQQEHMQQARTDRGNLFKVNHGHPQNMGAHASAACAARNASSGHARRRAGKRRPARCVSRRRRPCGWMEMVVRAIVTTVLQPHQLRQHLRPLDRRHLAAARLERPRDWSH